MRTGTAVKPKGPDEYLQTVPEPARSTLIKLRNLIRSNAPDAATEGMSYGMPAFHYKGALVCYAAFKDHCSLFPMSAALLEQMKDELSTYETSKGTIRFAVDKSLPAALVKKIVKARVAENEARKEK